jgi:hypothetical protein
MANVTGILESIKNVIAGVTGVGNVYTYRRDTRQDVDFQRLNVTGAKVNFWDIARTSSEERWPNKYQFQRTHTFAIRGFYAVKDASATELTFQTIVDRMQNRFRLPANRDLGGTVESLARGEQGGLQVQSVAYGNAHGALCHTLEGRLQVTENPVTVLTVGATVTSYNGPRIFYANSIGASAQLTISSTNPSFPRTYLIDEAPKQPWRSASLGSPSVTIDIDFGSATSIRAFAVKNHNFSAGTYRLYYGATSPATHVVTLSTKTSLQWVSFFATHTARYWRFSMREASIASAFYQIGELWLGNVVDLTKWHAGGSQVSDDDGMKQHETDGGQRWRLSGFQRESRTYHFKEIDEDTDWATWRRVFDHRGKSHPLYYVVNPAVPSSAFFCSITSKIVETINNTDKVNLQVTLDEEL